MVVSSITLVENVVLNPSSSVSLPSSLLFLLMPEKKSSVELVCEGRFFLPVNVEEISFTDTLCQVVSSFVENIRYTPAKFC